MDPDDYVIRKGNGMSSTLEDLQGETRTKETLQMLVDQMPSRLVLNSEHSLAKTTQSFIENVSLVLMEGYDDEWQMIGDLYLHKDDIRRESELMKGLSISYTSTISSNTDNPLFKVFLPFPHYNNEQINDSILKSNTPLTLGRWHKKEASPTEVGVIISALAVIVSPFVTSIYDVFLKEKFVDLLKSLKSASQKKVHYDFTQPIEFKGSIVNLVFLSNLGDWQTALDPINISQGLETSIEFLNRSELASVKQVSELRMQFDKEKNCFMLIVLKYLDGENLSIPA